MNRLKIVCATVALVGLLAFSGGVLAAKPPGAGGGGGGGTPGGGDNTSPDYGDLFVLYRDGNGVPYVTEFDSANDEGKCQQPLPSDACPEDCIVDGVIWIGGDIPSTEVTDVEVVEVDPATCGVPPECAICTQEVEFERDNVIRAREEVLNQQLLDATIKLATAGCVTLDPAGRPVASSVVDGVVVSSAIDSPLQNLAFYKQLMEYGFVGSDIDLHTEDFLVSAARALGASASKEGKMGVDMVVYMNEILGLTELGASELPRISQVVREEVKGVMTEVTKWFLDYGDGEYLDYSYDRETNFDGIDDVDDGLPFPAYIPADDPVDGKFEYVERREDSDGNVSYVPVYGPILSAVFPSAGGFAEYEGTLMEAFAQAADDTRAVINFMHNWPVPDEDATPIPCSIITPTLYDIFISEESGLQVPERMAAAGDGREGSVTVENGGPADAVDVDIMVSGVYKDANGNDQSVELLTELGGDPIFGNTYETANIDAGYSHTIEFFFVMDEATEITWIATAEAADDPNPGNNIVEEITIVRKPKGGGGGGDH